MNIRSVCHIEDVNMFSLYLTIKTNEYNIRSNIEYVLDHANKDILDVFKQYMRDSKNQHASMLFYLRYDEDIGVSITDRSVIEQYTSDEIIKCIRGPLVTISKHIIEYIPEDVYKHIVDIEPTNFTTERCVSLLKTCPRLINRVLTVTGSYIPDIYDFDKNLLQLKNNKSTYHLGRALAEIKRRHPEFSPYEYINVVPYDSAEYHAFLYALDNEYDPYDAKVDDIHLLLQYNIYPKNGKLIAKIDLNKVTDENLIKYKNYISNEVFIHYAFYEEDDDICYEHYIRDEPTILENYTLWNIVYIIENYNISPKNITLLNPIIPNSFDELKDIKVVISNDIEISKVALLLDKIPVENITLSNISLKLHNSNDDHLCNENNIKLLWKLIPQDPQLIFYIANHYPNINLEPPMSSIYANLISKIL